MDEAQAVRIERVLVLHDERQIGTCQAQVPDGTARRFVGQRLKRAVMTGRDGRLVDSGAGFRGGCATVAHVRCFGGIGKLGYTPAIIVDFRQFTEILDIVLPQHGVETQVETCRRVSQ